MQVPCEEIKMNFIVRVVSNRNKFLAALYNSFNINQSQQEKILKKIIQFSKNAIFKFTPLFSSLGAIVSFLIPCLTSTILSLQYQKQCIFHHHGVYIMDIYATLCCLAFALIVYNSLKFTSKSKLVCGVMMLIITLSIIVEVLFAMAMVKQDAIKDTSKLNQKAKICTSQIALYLKALTGMSVLQISFLVLSVKFDIETRNTLELSPTVAV